MLSLQAMAGQPLKVGECMPLRNLRILVVDDSQLTRALLRALLQETSGFEVIGEASDGLHYRGYSKSLF
jgi:hypothetical protein